jgi:hypothetical protein
MLVVVGNLAESRQVTNLADQLYFWYMQWSGTRCLNRSKDRYIPTSRKNISMAGWDSVYGFSNGFRFARMGDCSEKKHPLTAVGHPRISYRPLSRLRSGRLGFRLFWFLGGTVHDPTTGLVFRSPRLDFWGRIYGLTRETRPPSSIRPSTASQCAVR